jgi:NifU-like protein involved in Fe-S cluster formation/metal-sulfur cluster biosynthetic enzyme
MIIMKFPYNETVLEHFRDPKNVGEMENPDAKATEGSPVCGDMVTIYLRIDPKELRIMDIKFQSYGCASNIATGSIITEMAKGMTLEEARRITWKQAAEALGGLPSIKMHCSVLAVGCLREAIRDYEERHGMVRERIDTDEAVVMERLKHVMNPLTGLDMVETNLVQNMIIEDGVIEVTIDLPSDHQFAANLSAEVLEKLDALWDIQEVKVKFSE